jgi:hypothetical protein
MSAWRRTAWKTPLSAATSLLNDVTAVVETRLLCHCLATRLGVQQICQNMNNYLRHKMAYEVKLHSTNIVHSYVSLCVSSVNIVTRIRDRQQKNQGSITGRGKRPLFSPLHSDRLWSQISILPNGCEGLSPPERGGRAVKLTTQLHPVTSSVNSLLG